MQDDGSGADEKHQRAEYGKHRRTDEKRAKKELDEKGLSKLVGIVALVTVASCGADNIGLFVPYFVTLDLVDFISYSSCIFNIDFCFSIYSTKDWLIFRCW